MSQSPFMTIPMELISNITFYLNISDVVNLIKIHPFTSIQAELKRALDTKLLCERKHLEINQKKYIRETLHLATKDIKHVDLPDPFYIQNIFNDRDNQIQNVIPQIDYSLNIERLLLDRKEFDKEFNVFYESILRFYKEERCNTFPSHPNIISMILDRYEININN